MSNQPSSAVADLTQESAVLNQLLYRNFNQHRRTKLFNLLKAASKSLEKVLSIQWDAHFSEADTVVHNLTKKPDSKFHATKALEKAVELESLLKLLMQCDSWLYKAGSLAKESLREMTFVPLYTTWVALPGMLTGALAELIGQVVRRLLSLSQLLKGFESQDHSKLSADIRACSAVRCLDQPSLNTRLLSMFQAFKIKHSIQSSTTIDESISAPSSSSKNLHMEMEISTSITSTTSSSHSRKNGPGADVKVRTSTGGNMSNIEGRTSISKTPQHNNQSHSSKLLSTHTLKRPFPSNDDDDEDVGDAVVIPLTHINTSNSGEQPAAAGTTSKTEFIGQATNGGKVDISRKSTDKKSKEAVISNKSSNADDKDAIDEIFDML